MNADNKPLNEDIQYLNGQIDALHTLLLVVAESAMSKQEFRQAGGRRLSALESTFLNTTASDTRLAAIAHTKDWLAHVTS